MLITDNKLNRDRGTWRYFLHIGENPIKTIRLLSFTQEPLLNANVLCSSK